MIIVQAASNNHDNDYFHIYDSGFQSYEECFGAEIDGYCKYEDQECTNTEGKVLSEELIPGLSL